MTQPVPVHAHKTEFFAVGLSCRLSRLCRSNDVPLRVLNTKTSGFSKAPLRAERISMDFTPSGIDRLLR